MEQKELAERCVEYLERFQDLFPLEFRGQVFNLCVFGLCQSLGDGAHRQAVQPQRIRPSLRP